MIYTATCTKCGNVEIDKPMLAEFPTRHACGGTVTHHYTVIAVHYAAPGFYSTDVQRMKSLVGPDRFAKFEAQKADAEKRAKAGRLTPYEKVLESV